MPRGRVAPALEKTPSRTKLFTIDMPGARPDSAVSTMGINPSINSVNMATPQSESSENPEHGAPGNFTTTIPIFRGPVSGHPPRSVETQIRQRTPSGTEESLDGAQVPEISVKQRRADSCDDTQASPQPLPGTAMDGDPNHLSPLIRDKLKYSSPSGEAGILELANMATNPGSAMGELPPIGSGLKMPEATETLNLTLHQCARDGDEYNMKILLQNLDSHVRKKVNQYDEDDLTPLHYAARYNHLSVVKLLVQAGANVQMTGDDNVTPLHHAARYRREKKRKEISPDLEALDDDLGANGLMSLLDQGDAEESIVSYLVKQNANINAVDMYGQTPLHYAAMRGNEVACRDLLNFKNIINISIGDNQGITPLHCAALHNQVEIARMLIEGGADVMCTDKERSTPLHHACMEGNVDMVQLLFDAGARSKESWVKVNEMVAAQDFEFSTPLHHAVENSHYDVAKILLEKGAVVNQDRKNFVYPLHLAAQSGDVRICRLLVEHQARIDAVNSDHATALHRAAALNKVEALRFLVEKGAAINRRDIDNYTPLLLAATYGNTDAVELLLQKGADFHAQDKHDKTAIFLAAEENKIQVLKKLLSKPRVKQLINESDCYDNSPLHIAAKQGYLDIVQCLLENGADLDDKNEEEETPLHLAAKHGRTNIVRELIKTDTTIVNDEDENSNTALHLAAQCGHYKVVKLLLDLGADVSARNYNAWTPLDLAASKGWTRTCSVLLEEDAPVDPTDKNKTTPLHLASSFGHSKVVKLLLEWDADVTLKDDGGRNCLGRAIENHHVNVAEVIIYSDVWKDALRNAYVNPNTGFIVTPMRKLIRRMPEVALKVFDRCLSYGQEKNPESMDFEITFDYEFLEDVYARWITHNIQRQVTETGSDYTSSTGSTFSGEDDDVELSPNAQPYSSDSNVLKKNHPLFLMIQNEREALLGHPLVTSLLQHKWNALGSFFYYFSFAIYMVFLTFLTGYMISTDPPHTYGNDSSRIEDNECSGLPYSQPSFAKAGTYVIIALAGLNLFKEMIQLYQAKLNYLGWTNLIEWIVYVTALLLVISFNECQRTTGYRYEWQWHLGAIAVFLAWIDLVLFIQKFPRFGIYVVMFTDILFTFSQFFVVFFLFVIAFAVSFYALFQNQNPFDTVPKSFIKTSVMMIGEFEFDTIFNDSTNDVKYPTASYIIFVIFLVIMSILLMNLLVGLAVDDIKAVQEQAALKRMAMQVELALDVERIIPDFLRRRAFCRRKTIRPNRLFANPIQRMFTNSYLSPSALQKALNPDKDEVEKVKESQDKIVTQVKKLKASMQDIREHNQKLESLLKAIVHAQGIDWQEEDFQADEEMEGEAGDSIE
ncbi:hypothetical protein EGW08_014619 [Elysia chlorotica]|uniref:Ion transport domain-containing protein n=1 Tax=Elysia chlorotica TaxID=188477 RepID=A0A3S1HED0_ELYCH|nr:hypothetical protein EGW08_014619 [Elysia chlorotica]